MDRAGGHEANPVLGAQHPIHHPDQHDHAYVIIEPGVNDQGLQGGFRVPLGRRYPGHDGFQDVFHPQAGFGGGQYGLGRIQADHILDFLPGVVRISGGQVNLVQHGDDFHPLLDSGIAIGHRLGFHPLGGIHHQQSAFAGRQGTGYLIGKVHVPRGVDQIQVINLPVLGFVAQRRCLGFDGDAPFPLDIHGIEHLGFHFPVRQPAAALDEPVGQGGFTVVDVGDNGKIANVLHQVKKGAAGHPLSAGRKARILADFGQNSTYGRRVQEVMAHLLPLMEQYRHQFPPALFQFRKLIHVHGLNGQSQGSQQGFQGCLHVMAQVAVVSPQEGKAGG